VQRRPTTQYGPSSTFLGVPAASLRAADSLADAQAVIVGAPFDAGTSWRPGARFGPQAIRSTDYLPQTGYRPHLGLRVDPLGELGVVDVGDVRMPQLDSEGGLARLMEACRQVSAAGAIPVVLGGDHTITYATAQGVAQHHGFGRVALIHFDAHADTGDSDGGLWGHGTPMRRLIMSGAIRGDRFLQIGLRGYWPDPPILEWMAEQRMRWFEMTEVVERGLDECLTEALERAADDCDGVFLSVDVDVVDPGMAPGTGTPESGGLTSRQLLDAVRRIGRESNLLGMDVVEVAPAYDVAENTALAAASIALDYLCLMAQSRPDAI
jgi:agmatinase